MPELPEWIDASVLGSHHWKGWRDALLTVHATPESREARRRLAYDEIFSGQLALMLVRAASRKRKAQPIQPTGRLRDAVKLPFDPTGAQRRSVMEIDGDIAQSAPMLRLLQGDVGSGKTWVALMALLGAVESGMQAAMLAPTEILARQHYETLRGMLSGVPVNIAILTGRDKGKVGPGSRVLVNGAAGSWHAAWLWAAGLLLGVALPLLLWLMRVGRVPEAIEVSARGRPMARDWSRAEAVRDPLLYLLLAGLLAPPFIGTTIFFHQGYLTELRGYAPLAFAAAFPVMSVATVVSGFVCGHLIDRHGALGLLPFVLAPLALASLLVAVVVPVWGIYAFMLLLGISNGFTGTLMGALWPEVYGLANLGGIRSIIMSAIVLSTAIGPGITGALIDAGIGLPVQMLGMTAWCGLASLLLALAARRIRAREAAWRAGVAARA